MYVCVCVCGAQLYGGAPQQGAGREEHRPGHVCLYSFLVVALTHAAAERVGHIVLHAGKGKEQGGAGGHSGQGEAGGHCSHASGALMSLRLPRRYLQDKRTRAVRTAW